MTRKMMNPSLLTQLSHDGVDPGETRLGFGPLGQRFGVLVPRDADADGVSLHAVESRVVGGGRVEELPPQDLIVQRDGGTAALLHLRTHTQ